MKLVKVDLGQRSYDIGVGSGILSALGERLAGSTAHKIFVVSNAKVFGLYGRPLTRALEKNHVVTPIIIPDGEKYKTLHTVDRIYGKLIRNQAERHSKILALGGGVVGDIAGFAAATFLRGIDLIQVPTTLLAQVDSAVGGKVGVNHALGKNLIGAFHQPKLVWIDTTVLETLSEREFKAGLYEVIKYGVIWDAALFDKIENNLPSILNKDPEVLEELISRCCQIKAEIVSQDERENGLRMILNFGHTIGHALEAATRYTKFKHGEAVAWGMIAAAKIAVRHGTIPEVSSQRIERLILRVGKLPRIPAIPISQVLSAMSHDKKTRNGVIRFILPLKIGHVIVKNDIPQPLIRDVIQELS